MTAPAASREIFATTEQDADVIVVGAGPGGSSTAWHLAQQGLDVLLLEKSAFPREKVCGDGLTPRGVRALTHMGIQVTEENGWLRNKGLRIYGGGMSFELAWPELADFPPYGAVRPRLDLDEQLVRQAQKAGARLVEEANVQSPVVNESGRIVGVTATVGGRGGESKTYRAPLVVAADGNSARLPLQMGRAKRDDRPMGVAVRQYFTSPRTNDDHLESWLELWDGPVGKSNLLPGYGWIFGMGDGTVNVGLGMLNTTSAFGKTDYKAMLRRWLDATPEEWGLQEENATSKVLGGALPMGFNRVPAYADGLLLVGDAGGVVNPFNGEGIAYAIETGEMAARAITEGLSRPTLASRDLALNGYRTALSQEYGGYYTLGRIFVALIGDPRVMGMATKYGLPRKQLMKLTLKLLAGLYDTKGGDIYDKTIAALVKIAPSA